MHVNKVDYKNKTKNKNALLSFVEGERVCYVRVFKGKKFNYLIVLSSA